MSGPGYPKVVSLRPAPRKASVSISHKPIDGPRNDGKPPQKAGVGGGRAAVRHDGQARACVVTGRGSGLSAGFMPPLTGSPRLSGRWAAEHDCRQGCAGRAARGTLSTARRTAAAGEKSCRGKSGHHRARWSAQADPAKAAGKCHRDIPPMAGLHVRPAQARVKRCGKSAPASWRHGGQANPTGCKAKQDRSQVARQGPGRPLRWMVVHDKIRLTGVLRRGPSSEGPR
jgi:hypothetical protein